MKRLVVKTVLITVLSLVCVTALSFFSLFFFYPKALGNVFKAVGDDEAALYFYEKQYNKSGTADDLSVVVDLLDVEKDPDKVYVYTNELIAKSDFSAFCEKKDKNAVGMTTSEYYYAKFAVSDFYVNGIESAEEICKESVTISGYTDYNAYRILIASAQLTDSDKEYLHNKLVLLSLTLTGEEADRARDDYMSLY